LYGLFPENGVLRPYIGCDESGKGDYFGPLVVAAVAAESAEVLDRLIKIGARDSKKVSDQYAERAARDIIGAAPARALVIEPERYNYLYEEFKNLNRLLAWAFAQVIDDLSADAPVCEIVVVDKFGDEDYVRTALAEIGSDFELYMVTGAEEHVAVAAASLVARAAFLRGVELLSSDLGLELPKGATEVTDVGRFIVERFGPAKLGEVAKLHFKTTKQILND
jgi:ribonuclease HIII